MRRFDEKTVSRWRERAENWMAENPKAGFLSRDQVTTGSDAWGIANACGILEEAYRDRSVTDGHIQTALETIFPQAVFRDRKVY